MLYKLKNVACRYVKGFIKYTKDNIELLDEDKNDLFTLYSRCLENIYGLESSIDNDLNYLVLEYSESLTNYFKSLKGVPKRRSRISHEDRLNIVLFSKMYYLAVVNLSEKKYRSEICEY